MVVEYTQTRSGPTRVITENHRVYRDAIGHERNETSAVNGTPVTPARVAIYVRAAWPYGPDKFAVDSSAYQVAPSGVLAIDGRKAFSYAVVLKDAGAFAITELELDAKTALPLREHFAATTSTCSATGQHRIRARWPLLVAENRKRDVPGCNDIRRDNQPTGRELVPRYDSL